MLRYRAQLDFLIEHYSGRARKLDLEVRIALRMGIYQLRYLERVPPHAAVKESVELVKRAHKTSAAGFVNAAAAPGQSRPGGVAHARNRAFLPGVAAGPLGSRITAPRPPSAIAQAALREPEKYVRISPAGDRMQDIGSQSIVPLLALEAGQTLPRSLRRARQQDRAGARSRRARRRLRSALPPPRPAEAADRRTWWSSTAPVRCPSPARFDRILVDAPCSGTGTLGRNPEIKWRLTPDDLDDLPRRQSALLANALAAAGSRRTAGLFHLFARSPKRTKAWWRRVRRRPDCAAHAPASRPRPRGRFLRLL